VDEKESKREMKKSERNLRGPPRVRDLHQLLMRYRHPAPSADLPSAVNLNCYSNDPKKGGRRVQKKNQLDAQYSVTCRPLAVGGGQRAGYAEWSNRASGRSTSMCFRVLGW